MDGESAGGGGGGGGIGMGSIRLEGGKKKFDILKDKARSGFIIFICGAEAARGKENSTDSCDSGEEKQQEIRGEPQRRNQTLQGVKLLLRPFQCRIRSFSCRRGANTSNLEEEQQEVQRAPQHHFAMSMSGTLEKGAHHQALDLSEELPPSLHHHHSNHHLQLHHSNSMASTTAIGGGRETPSRVVIPPPYSAAESGGSEAPLELRGSLDCWACSVLVTAQNLVIAAINACLAGLVFGTILTPAIVMVLFGFLCHSSVKPHGKNPYCSDLLTDGGCVALLVVGFLLVTPLLVLALAAYCRLARHLQLGLCFIPYSRAVYKNLPAAQHRGLGTGCCGGGGAADGGGKGKVWV